VLDQQLTDVSPSRPANFRARAFALLCLVVRRAALSQDAMMTHHASLTSTDPFRLRAQKSEFHRLVIWTGILFALLAVILIRRSTDGIILANNAVFYPALGITLAAIVYESILLTVVWTANRRDKLLSDTTWRVAAFIDGAIPGLLLLSVVAASPKQALEAVAAPSLLLFPLVIILSILRLRPRFTLLTGIAAATFHWLLVIYAITVSGAAATYYPFLLSYGIILVFHGIAGWVVSTAMRAHVIHAAEDAEARFTAERQRDLLSRDLEIARDIQRSLLPKDAPVIPGFQVAGWSQPADQTGGDYFDWMVLPDGRVIFVIADATGHGIGPAMLISACRAYLRASSRAGISIENVLTEVNTLLIEDLPPGKFVTAAILILDPATAVGHLYSAGHAPLFYYTAGTDAMDVWAADELPLGIDSSFGAVKSRAIHFQPGDTLLLLTDGFFEWSNAGGELFGIARTTAAIKLHVHDAPELMIRELYDDVIAFAGGTPQLDDLTAVALQFVGAGSGLRDTVSAAQHVAPAGA
jgi:serine phosphatase RsbU (regulator of sigma subunit)